MDNFSKNKWQELSNGIRNCRTKVAHWYVRNQCFQIKLSEPTESLKLRILSYFNFYLILDPKWLLNSNWKLFWYSVKVDSKVTSKTSRWTRCQKISDDSGIWCKSQYNYSHLLDYYRVVEGVECWLKRVIHWLILHILLSFASIYWDLLWFTLIYLDLLRFNETHWDLLIFTDIYWELLRFTEIYWDLLRFTEIYWDLLRFTEIDTDWLVIILLKLFFIKSTLFKQRYLHKSLEGCATLGAALKMSEGLKKEIWNPSSVQLWNI